MAHLEIIVKPMQLILYAGFVLLGSIFANHSVREQVTCPENKPTSTPALKSVLSCVFGVRHIRTSG